MTAAAPRRTAEPTPTPTSAPAPAPAPAPRKPPETRANLLRAARGEFARAGFAGARVDQIVLKAGASPRMLYHHFGDKAGLYVAVLEEALGELRAREMTLDVTNSAPLDGLLQLFDFLNEHFESNPEMVRLLANENIERASYLNRSELIREMSSPVLANIGALLRRGEADGTLRPGLDPLTLYVEMVALTQFHVGNVHTLSTIFATDLQAPGWRAARHAAARTMLRCYLRAPKD